MSSTEIAPREEDLPPGENDSKGGGIINELKDEIKEKAANLKEGVTQVVEKIGEVNTPQDKHEALVDAGSLLWILPLSNTCSKDNVHYCNIYLNYFYSKFMQFY